MFEFPRRQNIPAGSLGLQLDAPVHIDGITTYVITETDERRSTIRKGSPISGPVGRVATQKPAPAVSLRNLLSMSRSTFILCVALVATAETLHGQRPTDLVNRQFSAEVTHVADGDTVDVLMPPARRIRVRLHGVDTPESNEAFSDRARTFTRVLNVWSQRDNRRQGR